VESINIDDLPEKEIIDEVKAGNRSIWTEVIKKYYAALLNFTIGFTKERESAEELVQDVFVNVWSKKDYLNIDISLRAYLYRATRNHALNYVKRRQFEFDYQKRLADTITPYKNEVDDQYHFNEVETALNEAIEALPEKRREIFKMSRYEDLTYKEISDALEVPVRTVHYQIGLALKELREKLQHLVDPRLMGG
jgi:RNA polymerase sigma-70 factor (ECF subfamily)